MSAAIITLERIFRHSGIDLPDPDPSMSTDDVLKHYARQFPRLMGAKIIPAVQVGDALVYEFKENGYGSKG